MHILNGGCHCGNILVDLELSRPPDNYRPRACDCEFCRRHQAAYVSDSQGSVAVWIQDAGLRGSYRQGSGQAEFLLCGNCGVLIGAFYSDGGRLYATVNARCVGGAKNFAAQQSISPRLLSVDEKTARWRSLWFSHVNVLTASNADGLHKLGLRQASGSGHSGGGGTGTCPSDHRWQDC